MIHKIDSTSDFLTAKLKYNGERYFFHKATIFKLTWNVYLKSYLYFLTDRSKFQNAFKH
jgi:hypothetical protein